MDLNSDLILDGYRIMGSGLTFSVSFFISDGRIIILSLHSRFEHVMTTHGKCSAVCGALMTRMVRDGGDDDMSRSSLWVTLLLQDRQVPCYVRSMRPKGHALPVHPTQFRPGPKA